MKNKTRIIATAAAVMTCSTVAAVTGTVAWFTASNIVSIDGIYVQAEKEEGFVINNEGLALADWGTSIKASHDGQIGSPKAQAKFIPTSTADGEVWYHANAEYQDNHTAAEGTVFTPLSVEVAEQDSGVYKAEISDGVNKNLYLLNSFYLKASTTSILNANGLWAKVSAISMADTPESVALNNTLRVLVRYGTAVDSNNDGHADNGRTGEYTYAGTTIWAPFRTSETDAARGYVVGGTSGTSVTAKRGGEVAQLGTSAVALPANNATNKDVDTFRVQVFAYYEGEDIDCYSDNITANLDQLSVSVKLSTQSTIA